MLAGFIARKDIVDEPVEQKATLTDDLLDELYDLMHENFKLREIREIAVTAEYDAEKIKKAYNYMLNYSSPIDNAIAFMKDCIKKEYYNQEKKPFIPKKNPFYNFMQREKIDFEEMERELLDN